MTPSNREVQDGILQQAHDWMLLLEDPRATPEDRRRFERWHSEDSRHADTFDQALTFKSAFSNLRREDFLAALDEPEPRVPAEVLRRPLSPGAWAPMLLGVAFIALVTLAPALLTWLDAPEVDTATVTAHSGIGETKRMTLPDGTEVTLGPDTHLKAAFSADQRRVELGTGTAYFDVAANPARPFTVVMGKLRATALGTEFDVRHLDHVSEVAVAEGEVLVRFPLVVNGNVIAAEEDETLGAGQAVRATLDTGLTPVSTIAIDAIAAWRHGRLVYSGASLADVLADARRYSHVPIVVAPGSEQMLELRVRGVFFGNNINDLLSGLAAIHPISIDRSDPQRTVLRYTPD